MYTYICTYIYICIHIPNALFPVYTYTHMHIQYMYMYIKHTYMRICRPSRPSGFGGRAVRAAGFRHSGHEKSEIKVERTDQRKRHRFQDKEFG